jgi:tetratricopeptide (TPR) repeat protein
VTSPASATRAGLVPVLIATALLPWVLGGTPIGASRAAAFLVIAGFSLACVRGGPSAAGLRRDALWLWPAGVLALLAVLQATPLPLPVLRAISPGAAAAWESSIVPPGGPSGVEAVARLEEQAIEAVPEAVSFVPPEGGRSGFRAEAPDRPSRATISYHPAATTERLAWFVALLAAFVLVREAAATRSGRSWIRTVLLVDLTLLAAAALAFRSLAPGSVLGLVTPLRGGAPYGPYVNPSHFAFLMEIAVPWLAALAWDRWRRDRSRTVAILLPAAGATLCTAAAVGSASKGAALLIPLSLSAVLVVGTAGRPGKRRAIAAAAGVFGILGVAAALTPLGGRIADFVASGGTAVSSSDRFLIWSHALGGVFASHPLLGTGFGAFRHAIPRALPAGEAEPWLQLHNDFLEVAVDGGSVAAALVLILAWAFWRRALAASWSEGPARLDRAGLLAGLAAVTIHAAFDFGHQMPGNALVFVVACALAVPGSRAPSSDHRWLRPLSKGAVVLAFVGFALLAVRGVASGRAFSAGLRDAAAGRYGPAVAELDRGAVGIHRFEARWMAGEVRLGIWDRMDDPAAYGAEGVRTLSEAAREFLASEREVAASGWPLSGLATAYRRVEQVEAAGRPVDLASFGKPPWARIGRAGRIAVGLGRLAVGREPTVSARRDALVETFSRLGLPDEAASALRESARIQPVLEKHHDLDPGRMERTLIEAFHEGAREALGNVPMTRPIEHRLSLGKSAFRLERFEEADAWFREVLDAPAGRLDFAEARFWLGLVSERRGRLEDAGVFFSSVLSIPAFRPAALDRLARLAERRGDWRGVYERLDLLRREQPGRPEFVVRWAAAAIRSGEAARAVEGVRAGLVRSPGDPDLRAALVEALLAAGDVEGASRELEAFAERFGGDPRVDGLRPRVAGARPGETRVP